jgi:hypothetical protein
MRRLLSWTVFVPPLLSCACASGGDDLIASGAAHGGSSSEAAQASGHGGATGQASASAGGSGGGGELCGNRQIDVREACDGDEFGGATCQSYGLGGGELTCNESCQVVVSGCLPLESCNNGVDDDQDGALDCNDVDCFMAAVCVDPCSSPTLLNLPVNELDRTTAGRPAVQANTCAASTGPEQIYQITADFSGTLGVSVKSRGIYDFAVEVRSSCGDPSTVLACANHVTSHLLAENLQALVVKGAVYFLIVDGVMPSQAGNFDLQMFQVTAVEGACSDGIDNDLDGRLDCDDPSACQGLSACTPGGGTTGAACSQAADCTANASDPICLLPSWGFAGGYCSEFCDLQGDDCAVGAHCHALGISEHGVCLDGCSDSGDCRPGYDCVELGLASKVCFTPPESSCNNFSDDDFDGLTDCEDPSACKGTPLCTPGAGAIGSPCLASNDCDSVANADPLCIDAWLGGYCSEFCDLLAPDCPPGATCTPYFSWPSGRGTCLKSCTISAECPSSTLCVDFGFATPVCAG